MYSIAIKTNNSQSIEYLKNNFKKIELDTTYFSCKNFKHYTNIIIHYKGNNTDEFIKKVSTILSFLVIYEYEEKFLKQIIYQDYFYFLDKEKEKILENCFNIIIDSNSIMKNKFKNLLDTFSKHLTTNKKIYLSGFINFRMNKYKKILNTIVDEAVNNFIIEKEYNEFISLLRLYINSSNNSDEDVHLVYSKDFSVILDNNKNVIKSSDDIFKAKFLSDITFSANDYTLNTLLDILPNKIHIHLIDNYYDEFINTLKLIFENRIDLNYDSNICKLYQNKIKR